MNGQAAESIPNVRKSLFEYVLEHTEYSEEEVVLEYFGTKLTFGAFRTAVNRIAGRLTALGIKPGDRVLISTITTPNTAALMYASNLIGAVPVMADVRLSAAEFYSLVCETKCKIAFISDFNFPKPKLLCAPKNLQWITVVSPCDGMPPMVRLFRSAHMLISGKRYLVDRMFIPKIKTWNQLFGRQKMNALAAKQDAVFEDGEIIFTTSGTTGTRKYVRIRVSDINFAAYRFSLCMDLSEIRSVLSIMPLFTCYGFLNSVHAPLVFSKKLFLYPIYKTRNFARILKKTRASASFGVIGQWECLLKDKTLEKEDLSFLKFASWGGDGCSKERIEEINQFLRTHHCMTKLYQGYGMTETVSAATLQTKSDYVVGSSGKPLPYVQISIVGEDGVKRLHTNEVGEICIHSRCQTKGYFHDEVATRQLIRIHDDGVAWIHTGDLGYLDRDGNLFVVGRKKRMFVTENGTKVFLSRLEEQIRTIAEVEECAAIKDEATKSTIILYVVPKKKFRWLKLHNKIMTESRNNLPAYLQPDRIIRVKSIPKNVMEKPEYPELVAKWNIQ